MKFTCLSGHPNYPCGVLKFKDTTILLDASLDMIPCLNYLPLPLVYSSHFANLPNYANSNVPSDFDFKECASRVFIDSPPEFSPPDMSVINFKHIDAILISSYQSALALPYLTELTEFNGTVYATEPAIAFMRLFMEELLSYIERCPKVKVSCDWKNHPEIYSNVPFSVALDNSNVFTSSSTKITDGVTPKTWRQIYTSKMVNDSLAKVTTVAFNEKINIFGCLEATPLPSGHLIGSCNWVIKSDYEKLIYISSSSTLTTHPKPMEMVQMKNADVAIVTNLSRAITFNPDSSLHDLCNYVKQTLTSNGNVLLPCYTSGIIYDLLECLVPHLDLLGLGHIPIYIISPVADQSLAYSNILAEWLTSSKQTRVYLPEEPFLHSYYIRSGRIKQFTSIHSDAFNAEYRTPCILFTGHPSLRFGDVVHFIELWGSSSANLIAFTDAEFPYLEALAPYQPLAIKVSYTPIDTSLNYQQVNTILSDLQPKNLLVPQAYTVPPVLMKHRNDLVITVPKECNILPFKRSETVNLSLKRRFAKITLDPEISNNLVPIELRPGITLATVTGSLEAKDNSFRLKPLTKSQLKNVSSLANWAASVVASTGSTASSSSTSNSTSTRSNNNNNNSGRTFDSFVSGEGVATISSSTTKPGEGSTGKEMVLLPPPKNYSWGSIDLPLFMQRLAKAGLRDAYLEHTPTGSVINLRNGEAFITLDENTTHIVCDIHSELRPLLREVVTKCLKTY